jgi:hypothetical protein
MMEALVCYLILAVHLLGMQVVVVDSVEILQDMLLHKVQEAQHLVVTAAAEQAGVEAVAMVAILVATAALTLVVVVVEAAQVLAAMAVLELLFYATTQT